MKKSYISWNSKDLMSDDLILKQLHELSGGALKMEENTQLSNMNDLVKRHHQNQNQGQNNNRNKHHKNKHKHNNNFKRNNNNNR